MSNPDGRNCFSSYPRLSVLLYVKVFSRCAKFSSTCRSGFYFGFRISGFFRPSAFGFRISGWQAHAILRLLGIEGEILWTTTRTDTNVFEFQVRRPGHFFFIKADFGRKRVFVRQSEVNLWGVIKVLHTFTGSQTNGANNRRDWALTSVWAYSMDAVAAGLIFMVLSSLYMWWKLPQKRLVGAVVLGLGSLLCGLFCVGLRWLF